MPAHDLQIEVSYQEVDLGEPLQKNILIGLRVDRDGDKTSKRRWLSSAEEAGMHGHHYHARAHTGCLGKRTGRGGKETSRQGTVLYSTITQPGVNSISDQKSKSIWQELAMCRQEMNFTCLILRSKPSTREICS